MENTIVHTTTRTGEDIETSCGEEERHEESELEYDQERDKILRSSRSKEGGRNENDTDRDDKDGDEHGKGNSRPSSPSSNDECATGSNGNIENQRMHPPPSESDMDSHSKFSAGDINVEEEQLDNRLESTSMDAHHLRTPSEGRDDSEMDGGRNIQESQHTQTLKEEQGEEQRFGDADMQETHHPEEETQDGTGAVAVGYHEAALPVDDVDEGSMETHSTEAESMQETPAGNTGARVALDEVAEGSMGTTLETSDEYNTQVSADILDTRVSMPEETKREDQRTSLHEENKPSSSEGNVTREIEPALMEIDDRKSINPSKADEEHPHKGPTREGNIEEDEDEQLREYWTRALQTSTSTVEVVEEIVKVLKHRQKTHDLLCPVCGSCVTRRVILRKRKRSSAMSVDRGFPEPVDEGQAMEGVEEQGTRGEYQDTVAFGCLSCFSLFFEKGRQFLHQLQADMTPESFNCLPLFVPPYPWGMTQMKSRSPGEAIQPPNMTGIIMVDEELGVSESGDYEETSDRTCTWGLGPVMLPDYPWGHCTKSESLGQQVQIPEPVGAADDATCTCGLVPALLPDYAWGRLSRVDGGAHTEPTLTVPQAQPEEEIKGKGAEDKGSSCVAAVLPDYPWGMTTEIQVLEEGPRMGEDVQNGDHVDCSSAILPSYPWGVCSADESVLEENISSQGAAPRDCTCGLGAAMLPLFPWGQTLSEVIHSDHKKGEDGAQEVHSYIKQNTKIEARITSETDVLRVTTSKTTYPGEKPPPNIKNMIPQKTSQTVQHVRLDQTVTIIDASVKVEGVPPPSKLVSPLVSLPSTGFAIFDMAEEAKGRLENKPSTGYAQLQEIAEDEPDLEIQEDPMSLKYPRPKPKDNEQPKPEELYHKPGKTRPEPQPIGTPFPSFQWYVRKLDAGDLTTPLLEGSAEAEGETFVSVLKPTPGVDEPKSANWLSIFQLSKPPEKEGITSPLLPAKVQGCVEEIEEVKLPDAGPPISAATEAVIDVPPADLGVPSVGTLPTTAIASPVLTKKDPDGWDILKSIVYGGLDISVASLGVTSSAAGGNAITRTVVYMGLATMLSGLIGFYHNVLNLYHYNRDHYTNMVGVSLMLHGTVAIISYVVFGLLSPLIYLFSYRETDNRDDKFILCCVVAIVAVTALALGKAKVSNKPYLKTVGAYLLGGVLAAIVGYLTGEHVAELLEEWGI